MSEITVMCKVMTVLSLTRFDQKGKRIGRDDTLQKKGESI